MSADADLRHQPLEENLFGRYFTTAEMTSYFSPRATVSAWARTEAALAAAQSELGLVPEDAAKTIVRIAETVDLDLKAIQIAVNDTWHPLMGFINQLKDACGEAGEYVHWGATTQDIMDTGASVQYRNGLSTLDDRLREFIADAAELAERHAETVMAGRTHGQHALPTTFGYKAGTWADEISRQLDRLAEVANRVCVTNLTGAVGSMAATHPHGPEVQRRAADLLGLRDPTIGWHATRDRVAELVHLLASIAGSCGRIAGEVIALQKTELDELSEPFALGKIGSSTMPQKRNPMACEAIVACAIQLRALSGVGLDSMRGEHERDMGTWAAEWRVMPEAFRLADAALANVAWVVKDLMVNEEAMTRNLQASNGLILAESLMMRLAEHIGRPRAHDLVYQLAMDAHERGLSLQQAVGENSTVGELLSRDGDAGQVLLPAGYVGHAPEQARAAADAARHTIGNVMPLASSLPQATMAAWTEGRA